MKEDVKYGNDSQTNVCMEIYELYEDLVDLAREASKSRVSQAAFEDKIRGSDVSKFLYDDGSGKMTSIKALVKIRNQDNWINNDVVDARDQKKKRRPIAKLKKTMVTGSSLGSANKIKSEQEAQREVCWDIDRRGYSGETLLHVCFMSPHNKDVNFEIAKQLIKAWPKMINDFILGTENYGETCLHKAIVNENISMIKFLIENGADLNVHCYGRFFRPDDQKAWCEDSLNHEHFILYKKTNYEGLTYWGETPLTFAACLDLDHIFRSLWVKGCDINAQDTNGNTVLHMMVLHDKKTSKEHLQMLKGVIYKLLDEKWKTFGRFNFFARLAFFLLYLAVLTTAFYLRPGKDPKAFTVHNNVTLPNGSVIDAGTEVIEPCYLLYTDTSTDQARVVFEIITLIGSLSYLFFAAKETYHLGKWSFMELMVLAPAKAMFLLSCCFIILACFGRIPPCNPYYEDVFITFAILTACPYSLFFLSYAYSIPWLQGGV